jgi:hypothetical protein
MIRKIIILGLIVFGIIVLYRKFIAPTVDPFLQSNRSGVDLFQKSAPNIKANEAR